MITMIKGLTTGGERVRMIKTSEIMVSRPAIAPRTPEQSDDCSILQLKDSLHRHGILVPLTVCPCETGYRLVSGERRLRAALELGFAEVPCVVFPADDKLCAEFALIESIHRRQLDMFEQAESINNLILRVGLTREEAARQLSCSVGCVSNKLRLLRFDPEERTAILRGGLTERHARAILRLGNRQARLSMIDRVAREGISVSRTEELVERALADELHRVSADISHDRALLCSSGRARAVSCLSPIETTMERAVKTLSLAGVKATVTRIDGDGFSSFTITVPTSIKGSA